jgi:uncharacterized membrane protein YqjE
MVMAKDMKAVGLVTFFLVVYTVISTIPGTDWFVFVMYLMSPVLVIWMVYRVLKAQVQVEETFDEKFYQDRDMKRNTDL